MCTDFLIGSPGIKRRWEGLCGSAFICWAISLVQSSPNSNTRGRVGAEEKREEGEEGELKEERKVGEGKGGGWRGGGMRGEGGGAEERQGGVEGGRGMRRSRSKQLTES